jgi:hypothetical protein
METILIRYFHSKLPDLEYTGKESLPYSREERDEIIDHVLKVGYNVMLQQTTVFLIIWIDRYRFQQR